jgi:hypothetical protein
MPPVMPAGLRQFVLIERGTENPAPGISVQTCVLRYCTAASCPLIAPGFSRASYSPCRSRSEYPEPAQLGPFPRSASDYGTGAYACSPPPSIGERPTYAKARIEFRLFRQTKKGLQLGNLDLSAAELDEVGIRISTLLHTMLVALHRVYVDLGYEMET